MKRKLISTIPYDNVQFKWISNHYDVHLNGTCIYNNELCEFENDYPKYIEEINDYEEMYVRIYKLNIIGKLKYKWKQFLFETCVGYHWSYPQKKNNNFYYRNPKWLYRILFNLYYNL